MEKMEVKKDLAKRYVEVCHWIWAKTMPNIPHEYIVRGQSLPERDFVDFVKIIREYGVEEYWRRYKNKYLYLDGYKYWTMGNPIDETTIINRQKVFSAYDEIAEKYDSLFTDPVYAQEDEEIRVQIDWRGENVLDVGCGTGLLIDILKIDKGKYLGVDPSSNMLAKLKWKYPSHLIMNKPFEELNIDKLKDRYAIALYGSCSYIMPQYLIRFRDFERLFLMFYSPEYSPITYDKTGKEIVHYRHEKRDIELLYPKCYIYKQGNYIIVVK